jgi:hypothetical protein
LDIRSSNDNSLLITIGGGTQDLLGGWLLDGTYRAQRCGTEPPVVSPSAAAVFLGSMLPAGSSSSPTVGPNPDPTALYVFVGPTTETYSAPLSQFACTATAQLAFRLPAALQVTGIVDLTNPSLAASFNVSLFSGGACSGKGDIGGFTAAPTTGKLDILSIEGGSISFRLSQAFVLSSVATLPYFDAEGLYQGTMGP